jgi:hypothetical protein
LGTHASEKAAVTEKKKLNDNVGLKVAVYGMPVVV